ncbi:MAG TPA: type I methionyl aminopeptidase [Planctomycetota bacterium]|nr:type I methionyl aminopeptidase [Planctomycetota bacterium]
MSRDDRIDINGPEAIARMRRAGTFAAALLHVLRPWVRPGTSTLQLNQIAEKWTREHGGVSAPLGYRGFPKSICTSVNDVICHGIPSSKEVLREGDIVNVDVTPKLDGWHGDVSETFYVGRKISDEARLVTETARESLGIGVAQVRPGGRIGDIGAAIQAFAEGRGCSVVREFCGHGINQTFHTGPSVPHYGVRGEGPTMRPGMIFTIEPMINAGHWKAKILKDGWTAKTADGRLSAQFEHTVLVTGDGVEVLTDPERVAGSEFDPGDLRGTPYDPDAA